MQITPSRTRLLFVAFANVALAAFMAAKADEPSDADLQLLKQLGVETSDEGLVTFLRERERSPATPEEIKALIAQLGADAFAAREEALKQLARLGSHANVELQKASAHPDFETRSRAKRLLTALVADAPKHETVLLAVARTITSRKTHGAEPYLLRLLAEIEQEQVRLATRRYCTNP